MSRPTKPGWYWLWPDGEGKPKPVEVIGKPPDLTVVCSPFRLPVMFTDSESWGDEIPMPTTRNGDA